MYEDLEQIARLKFVKVIEETATQTAAKVQELQNEYAALTGASGVRSGQHEASIGRVQIEGAVKSVRALSQIWVELIERKNGFVARSDIPFVVAMLEEHVNTKRRHLRDAFSSRRPGGVANLLNEEAVMGLHAVIADVRRDLEIQVREREALPARAGRNEEHTMEPRQKKRLSPGRRVLVGRQARPGTVVSVDNAPSEMGEFRHIVKMDADGQSVPVAGCDLQAFPELDGDLKHRQESPIHVHIENSSVGNLNLGSQVGAINTALEVISTNRDSSHQQFAQALKELTEAVVRDKVLPEPEKQDVVQALSGLAEQAAKKPEERSKGSIRAIVSGSPAMIAVGADLTTLWNQFGPAIKAFFGL